MFRRGFFTVAAAPIRRCQPFSIRAGSQCDGAGGSTASTCVQRRAFRLVDPRPSETAARLAAEAALKSAESVAAAIGGCAPNLYGHSGSRASPLNASPPHPVPSGPPFDAAAFQQEVIAKTMEHIQSTIHTARQADHLMDLVSFYCSLQPAKVNLNDIVVWMDNPRYDPYIHCHRQFPLLVAHLIRGICTMPEGLSSMPSIVATRNVLLETFAALTALPVPVDVATEQRFVEALTRIVERHAEHDILMKMATGVVELKRHHNRHREALARLRAQHRALQRRLHGDEAGGQATLHPVHSREEGKAVSALANDLLRLQDPLDRFNRFLVEFNFTARQMLDFADRMSNTKGNDSPKPSDNCLTMTRPSERMSQLVSLEQVVRDAVYDAKSICDSHYGDCPEVRYNILTEPVHAPYTISALPALEEDEELLKAFAAKTGAAGGSDSQKTIKGSRPASSTSATTTECGQIFGHICPTVHYIIVELMKNAFRASIERHAKRNSMGMLVCDDVPPVQITINARPGLVHSCVCVEDLGTGIRRDHMPFAMSYSYTTAKGVLGGDEEDAAACGGGSDGGVANTNEAPPPMDMPPLAGFGYGLPMSRTYARCFGGDVLLNSVEGSGTQVYLYLKAASSAPAV